MRPCCARWPCFRASTGNWNWWATVPWNPPAAPWPRTWESPGESVFWATRRRWRRYLPAHKSSPCPPAPKPSPAACWRPCARACRWWLATSGGESRRGGLGPRRGGLPVVASDVGGLSELVDNGVNGVLIPRGEAGALSAALARLIDRKSTRLNSSHLG